MGSDPLTQTQYASLSDRIDLLVAEIQAVNEHMRDVNERLSQGEVVTVSAGGSARPFVDRAVELLRECQEALNG